MTILRIEESPSIRKEEPTRWPAGVVHWQVEGRVYNSSRSVTYGQSNSGSSGKKYLDMTEYWECLEASKKNRASSRVTRIG